MTIQEAENTDLFYKNIFFNGQDTTLFFPLYLTCDAGALTRQEVVKGRKEHSAFQDASGETACCRACTSGVWKLIVQSWKHISGSEINKVRVPFHKDV